ncbi:MAG: AMP-binding protein [Candidatus Omnitrophica bacterium]|nr:AMP-binding protein [Candidatus Omnitrophota bacterium]
MESLPVTLNEILKRQADTSPQKLAIIYKERKISYRELDEITNRLANSLVGLGIRKGDRVGIMLPRIPELVIAYLGLSKCGAISFPLSNEISSAEIENILSETQPFALIVHSTFLRLVRNFAAGNYLIVLGGKAKKGNYYFEELLKEGKSQAPLVSVSPEDTFYLNYTSGITGSPKGAITTHSNIFYNTLASVDALGLREDDIHLCMFASYSHPHEIFARAFYLGGIIVLADSIYPKSLAREILRNRVTVMMALPPFYEMLLEAAEIRPFDLSSLRIAESGGMHTQEDLKQRFRRKFGIPILAVWGSTETTGIAIANSPNNKQKENSVGKVCKHYRVKVLDEDRKEVPTGKVGELVFEGPAIVSGYYQKPEEVKQLLPDGCYFSGDIGRRDEEGYFFLRGRKSGMLKVGGWKVYPLEVEVVLNSHPHIQEAVVVGLKDRKRGEVPKTLIVLKPGRNLTIRAIIDYCRKRLARYKVPKAIEFADALPKLASGKIDRKALDDVS